MHKKAFFKKWQLVQNPFQKVPNFVHGDEVLGMEDEYFFQVYKDILIRSKNLQHLQIYDLSTQQSMDVHLQKYLPTDINVMENHVTNILVDDHSIYLFLSSGGVFKLLFTQPQEAQSQ